MNPIQTLLNKSNFNIIKIQLYLFNLLKYKFLLLSSSYIQFNVNILIIIYPQNKFLEGIL